jgi:hypothetical protein
MTARELIGRMAAWMRRGRLGRELEAELEAHIQLLARDFEHEGMPRERALARARRRVGHSLAHREESRDYWGFPRLDAFLQDARYAVRGLARSPGFFGQICAAGNMTQGSQRCTSSGLTEFAASVLEVCGRGRRSVLASLIPARFSRH